MKKIVSLLLLLLLLTSQQSVASTQDITNITQPQADIISIPPNQAAILQYNATDHAFHWIQHHQPTAYGQDLRYAISRAPDWIELSLLKALEEVDNLDEYISLLLEAPTHYVDEIAYCIAYAPQGDIASPEILYDNVEWIYRIAEQVNYASIKELQENSTNYGSTIQYQTLTETGIQTVILPADIYYEYIVQPEIEWGNADYIYGVFWREYLWNHNDLGYPLLKEKLAEIDYLWDNHSYSQPANRLWTNCITEHPTAIEAISYWVGKTVPAYATGDRPNQPNIIAHQHNGYCGELRTLATAATRAALIACVPISNLAEDHVWREFYERGWHQADNWWADTGGVVDQYDVYRYGWGKKMSSVYANNPDDTTYDVTSKYLHQEDRITVNFKLENYVGDPIDGARILVLVKGLNDISWIKYRIINSINQIWNTMPSLITDMLFGWLYDVLIEKITGIDDIQEFLSKSCWAITDASGSCSLDLGPGFDYTFLIQRDSDFLSYQYLKTTSLLQLKNASNDANYTLRCFQPIKKTKLSIEPKSLGEYLWEMQGEATALISSKNPRTMIIGEQYYPNASYREFVVDEDNYQRYLKGKKVVAQDMQQGCFITDDNNWYLIVESLQSHSFLLYQKSPQLQSLDDANKTIITFPLLSNFDCFVVQVGETIEIRGNGEPITEVQIEPSTVYNNWRQQTNTGWEVHIDTTGWIAGDYQITLSSEHSSQVLEIELFDVSGPKIQIETPEEYQIITDDFLTVSGTTTDAGWVESVEISIDRGPYRPVEGLNSWTASEDVSNLSCGEHRFSIQAKDLSGNIQTVMQTFVIASDNTSDLTINEIHLNTATITNTTNVIVYANCSSTQHSITHISVWYHINDTAAWISEEMYRYADFPPQGRHEEDPLNNQTNTPIYGLELGLFKKNEHVSFYIAVKDSSGTEIESEILSFEVA